MNQGLQCNICGWVAGVQSLESRVAIATEIFRTWSIQNFLNCKNTNICSGATALKVGGTVINHDDYVVENHLSEFIKTKCFNYNNCTCLNSTNVEKHSLLRDLQWFFVGEKVKANTSDAIIEGLQEGPVSTCYMRKKWNKIGNDCDNNTCVHANFIVGYDEKKWILQESIGAKFEYPVVKYKTKAIKAKYEFTQNGTWYVNRGTPCEKFIIHNGVYLKVYFDLDRANAYFKNVRVPKNSITIVERTKKEIQNEEFTSVGIAKRRCSLMGKDCRGVVDLDDVGIQLIKGIKKGSTGSNIRISKKTHMVVYLHHATDGYLSIQDNGGKPKLAMTQDWNEAAPFFTSSSRFISYRYPHLLLGDGRLEKHNVNTENPKHFWDIQHTNLRNLKSRMSLDVQKAALIGSSFDKESPSQRFNLSISGQWRLYSPKFGYLRKKKRYCFTNDSKAKDVYLRWQNRQILLTKDYPFAKDWTLSTERFKLGKKENFVAPTDTLVVRRNAVGKKLLGVQNGRVKMLHEAIIDERARWTFEYGDIEE